MKVFSSLRRAAVGALAASGFALAGCRDTLNVDNPRLITEGQLADPQLANVLMNTAVSALQINYDEFVWNSAILTDEALNATNDYHSGELNQRIVELAQGDVGPYNILAQYRATADTAAGRLRKLVKNPQTDLRLARADVYAGYGYVFMAEFLCTAPINGGKLLTDDELETIGLSRFNEAISIATAAKAAGPSAVADTILNFARVGAARASLNLGNKADAIAFGSLVAPSFRIFADYIASANTSLENSLWFRVNGQNKQLGVHPLMQGLNDPRVRYVTKGVLGHNQLTVLNVPYSPRTFSTFDAVNRSDSVPIQAFSSIEIASGLEARYIVAEASGATAQTLALVNERRAVGGEPLSTASGDTLMAQLREEKRRDFFLGARRLGDLRRYKAQGVGDFFPSGPHPTKEWGLYGSATCFIIDQAEVSSNPNVAGYTPPPTRPPGYSP